MFTNCEVSEYGQSYQTRHPNVQPLTTDRLLQRELALVEHTSGMKRSHLTENPAHKKVAQPTKKSFFPFVPGALSVETLRNVVGSLCGWEKYRPGEYGQNDVLRCSVRVLET